MAAVRNRRAAGIWLVIRMSLVASVLLVINSALFMSVYGSLAASGPSWLKDPKATQLAFLVGPIALLVGEWWLIDRLRSQA